MEEIKMKYMELKNEEAREIRGGLADAYSMTMMVDGVEQQLWLNADKKLVDGGGIIVIGDVAGFFGIPASALDKYLFGISHKPDGSLQYVAASL